ncbi:MAG: hypothetical protein N5P05_004630 (plasmid) [Chroococcopsis gigantea SAG 12.99]|jgi:hypothetical protein|nr:hypothetical protein [Chroococcopsis gigantea SAG 12.99]
MATSPKLVDLSVNLIGIDGLSPDEIELLMASAKSHELETSSALIAGR